MRDSYDRKQDHVILRFFSSGNRFTDERNKVWVAYKSNRKISKDTLFYAGKTKRDVKKEEIESLLYETVEPMSYIQKTAEWFLMKQFMITGTMASNLS